MRSGFIVSVLLTCITFSRFTRAHDSSLTLSIASMNQGSSSNNYHSSDINVFIRAWNARTLSRGRSVADVSFFNIYGDLGNQTYIVRSAWSQTNAYFDTVIGESADPDRPENSALVLKDAATNLTFVHMRHDGFTQKMFMHNTITMTASNPMFVGSLPDEMQPVNTSEFDIRKDQHRRCTADISSTSGKTIIRVGVVHTPQTAHAIAHGSMDGSRAIEMIVAASVAEANSVVYPQSGIGVQLELCFNGLLNDSSIEQNTAASTLYRFQSSAAAASIRNTNNCDTMTLYSTLEALGRRACGIGYMFPGTHSVVAAECFQDNYSFLHELHHNFGSCHGYPASQCGSGANGYGDSVHKFRTIEAYSQACGNSGQPCSRIPRVSNSLHSFHWNTWPIGDTYHNNAWLINARKDSMSSRRCS